MPVDWSDDIVVVNLADEPALSDELASLIDRLAHRAEAPEGADHAGPVPHAVLDFSQVTYISSSNIAQLLRLRQILSGAGRELRLCAMPDDVWSIMLVTGLDKVFRFAPDPMTALAGIQIDHPAE